MCLGFSREISCSKTLDNNSSFRQEISFNLSGCGSVTVEQRDVSLEIAAIYHLATFSLLLRMIILLGPFISFPGRKRFNHPKEREREKQSRLKAWTFHVERLLTYASVGPKLYLVVPLCLSSGLFVNHHTIANRKGHAPIIFLKKKSLPVHVGLSTFSLRILR